MEKTNVWEAPGEPLGEGGGNTKYCKLVKKCVPYITRYHKEGGLDYDTGGCSDGY